MLDEDIAARTIARDWSSAQERADLLEQAKTLLVAEVVVHHLSGATYSALAEAVSSELNDDEWARLVEWGEWMAAGMASKKRIYETRFLWAAGLLASTGVPAHWSVVVGSASGTG